MERFLLDTTVIIDFLRGKPQTVQEIRDLNEQGASMGCCPINIIEVLAGMRQKEESATLAFLESLEFYDLDAPSAQIAGDSLRHSRGKGITLTLADVAIAGVAIANDLTLLTDNARHYPQKDIKIRRM